MKRISVVMPVLNREQYLPAAIESVLGQSFTDWELILSDGGSHDASVEVMRRYARRDKRIRVFLHPGTNAPEGRNAALAEAGGEFVAMLDSDDVTAPNRLAMQIDYLDKHPEITAVGGNFNFIDAGGQPLQMHKYEKRLTDPEELRRHVFLGWHCFLQSTMLFHRSALTRVNGYRSIFRYAEEDDLYYRLYHAGAVMTNLPAQLVSYRWHGANACIPSLATQLHRVAALASAYCRMNGIPDPVDSRRRELDYPFLLFLFERLGDEGLPPRLFWIGLLQAYGVGGQDMLADAWRGIGTLRSDDQNMKNEIRRHWQNCKEKYPDVASAVAARKPPVSSGTALADILEI